MKIRAIICVAGALILSTAALAQTKALEVKKDASASDFPARLEASANQVGSQITSLEAQLAAASIQDRETLERRIVELKRQGEIDRLQILLDWAKVQGDAKRVEEVQSALSQWQNPPQPEHLTEAVKGADSPRASNDKAPATTNSK